MKQHVWSKPPSEYLFKIRELPHAEAITPPQILKLLGISSVGCSHRDLLRLVVTGTAEECRTQLEPLYDKLGAKMIFALTERNYSPDLFDFLEEVTAF